MNLLQMSLSGAVMILVIAVIRALAINKLPKTTFLILWSAVVVRLLIPYSLHSALSVYSLLGRLTAMAETVTDSGSPSPFTLAAPVYSRMPMPGTANADATAPVAVNPWPVVWAAGALMCAAFFAAAYWKCRREFKTSLPVCSEYAKHWLSEHRICRTIEIRQSGRILTPLTYGIFRPVILMPKTTAWDDRDTLKYVLTHEYVHIRRFDAVTKLVLTTAFCVHWFNPAVWLMYVLANRDMELSCDETVIRQFGEHAKSAYAMALIRMEETRSGLTPLCNNFSKNAIEERIVAIMKIKKLSLVTLIASAILVVGVTTAFATSAPADKSISAAYFSAPKMEWWTYDEYKAWLENEKVELQGMIGQKAWTGSRGEFVWTQEIIDEAIAMYEGILENIKNGMLYSKTINGEDAFCTLSSGMADTGAEVQEGDASAADFTIYEPYGLIWDEGEKALFWNGQRVRYFRDSADLDGAGGVAIRFEYLDAGLEGEIDVHTVRQRVQNADGSFNPLGPLAGLEKYSQAEYDLNT